MLKIIGIILLAILLLILVLLLEILFVPVRYRAQGYYIGSYEVKVRFSWLFHLLSLKIFLSKDKPISIIFHVLGITVYNNQKKNKIKNKKPKSEKKQNEQHIYDAEEPKNSKSVIEYDNTSNITTEQTDIISSKSNKVITSLTNEDEIQHNTQEESKKVKKAKFNLKAFFENLKRYWRNIRYTIHRIYVKIIDIIGNINYYIDIFQQEQTKKALEKSKKRLVRIWKNLRPRHFEINLRIGQEDPAYMGKILGVWGMLYPFHKGNIKIEPDFEKNIFDGDFKIKGHLSLFVFLWTLCIYLFDKDIEFLKQSIIREA